MFTFETLKQEFENKINKEFEEILQDFVEDIKNDNEKYIEDRTNKVATLQEIRNYLRANISDPKAIKALLNTENVLFNVYEEWRNADGALYDAMEYTIDKGVDLITTEYYEKEKEQENGSKNKKCKDRESR